MHSNHTTAPPSKNSEVEFENPMTYALIVSTICLVVMKMQKSKVEIGRIFRNSLYGQYYIGNERIDQSVVEVADQNPNYRRGKDEVNETVIQDANPQYLKKDTVNDNTAAGEIEDDDNNSEDNNMNEPIEDDDGYARLPIRT